MLTKLKIHKDQGTWFDWFFTYAHKQEVKSVGSMLFQPVKSIAVVGNGLTYQFRPPLLPRIYDSGFSFKRSLRSFVFWNIMDAY